MWVLGSPGESGTWQRLALRGSVAGPLCSAELTDHRDVSRRWHPHRAFPGLKQFLPSQEPGFGEGKGGCDLMRLGHSPLRLFTERFSPQSFLKDPAGKANRRKLCAGWPEVGGPSIR